MSRYPRKQLLIVGAGRVIERLYAPALEKSQFRAAAVVDLDPSRRQWAEKRLGVQAHTSIKEALSSVAVDAALVTTPPAAQRMVAEELIALGLPLLIEKPAARSRAEARALLDLGRGVPVQLALSRRYWRRYRRLKASLPAGVDAWEVAIRTSSEAWGKGEETAFDIVEDLVPHAYDIATHVLGVAVDEPVAAVSEGRDVAIEFPGSKGRIRVGRGSGWSEEVICRYRGRVWEVRGAEWSAAPWGPGRLMALTKALKERVLAESGIALQEPVAAIRELLSNFAVAMYTGVAADDLVGSATLLESVRGQLERAGHSPLSTS